jgi:PAT family beta-lactamase induction signal transducer AmpG
MTVSVIMFKNLGMSNTDTALYTSWLYLPWVIKPFWSPFVDLLGTKRVWIVAMQLLIGAGLAGVAFSVSTDYWVAGSLSFLWLMAFASATHDISADGFYMLGLNNEQQSFFVGIRNTFYRIAIVFAQGVLVMAAGFMSNHFGDVAYAWSLTFYIAAALLIALALYHYFVLPNPSEDVKRSFSMKQLGELFKTFFTQKGILLSLAFILLYRLGESQLAKIASPFMLDPMDKGGLGLATEQVGFAYGTVGVVFLLLGGVLGGLVVAKHGLKRWLWPMVVMMNVPNLVYIYFAYFQPESFAVVISGISLEQFGYGFGFTGFMLYLIKISQGEFKTAHYAICTGFMALGMMIPGMWAGAVEEALGYQQFFIWVCLCTIPGFILTYFISKRI